MKRRKFSKNFRILILIFSILLIAGFYASSFGFNIPLFQSPRIVENFEISFHNPSDNYNAGMDAFDKVINSLVLKSNVELDNEDIESIDVLIDGNMFKSYEKGISVLDSYVGYLIVIPLSPDYLPEGNHVMELVVNLKNGKRSSITHSYFSDVTRPDVKISPDGLTLNVWDENGIKEVKSKYYGDNGFEEISGLNFEGKEIIDGKEYSKYKFENFNVHLGRIIHFVLDENDNERLISSSGAKGSVAVSDYLRNNGFINEEINEEIKKILEQGNNNNNNNNNNQRSGSSCNIPAKFILPLYYDSTIPGDKDRVQKIGRAHV